VESIDGRNSHKLDHRVALGMSYGLGNRQSVKRDAVIATGDSREPPPESR
jgi:hypothetical protein